MTRTKHELDLVLSIGGKGALKGALTPEDLADLADLLKGLQAFDPSLANIRMVGSIKKGSAIVSCEAPHPKGMVDVRPPRVAAKAFFQDGGFDEALGWKWSKAPRYALDRITKRKSTLGVLVPPAHPDEPPFRIKLGRKDFERFNQKIAAEPKWNTICGTMLEIDLKDRSFEIHTARGQITCPFPAGYTDEQMADLLNQVVPAEVTCQLRPHTGRWTADECKTVLPRPQVEALLPEHLPSGLHPPKHPMIGGFTLDVFAPSLDAAAGESLASFLKDFEGE